MATTPKAPKAPKAAETTKPAAKAAAKPTTRRASSARAAGKRGAKPVAVLPENHTPSEAVAFEIRQDRIDLSPSISRIQGAGLNEEGTLHALNLFRESLTSPGDPNRDPMVAVEAGRRVR